MERDIERELTDRVKAMGGLSFKWVSPGQAGVPDRIVIMPGGRVWFVELKTNTGRLRTLQKIQIRRLQNVGANAVVVRGWDDLESFLAWIQPKGGDADALQAP